MSLFEITTILFVLTALFGYLNARTMGLPTTIGVMLISMGVSVVIAGLGELGLGGVERESAAILQRIDFKEALLHGILSFLLFAGALKIDINELYGEKWLIALLATAGVAASALLVGGLTWLLLKALNLQVPFIGCLLFGALIAPTDPVAVMAILNKIAIPDTLRTQIAGESLFNDGIGITLFLTFLSVSGGSGDTAS